MAGGKLEITPNEPRIVSLNVRYHTPEMKQQLLGELLALKNVISIKFVNNGGYGDDTVEVEYAVLDIALQMASISNKIQQLIVIKTES